MIDFIFIYCVSTLIVANVMSLLEQTNIKIYLLSPFIKEKIYTIEDCNDYVSDNWGKVGELLTCPLCYGTWLALITALVLCYLTGCELLYAFVIMFSSPFLAKRISLVH